VVEVENLGDRKVQEGQDKVQFVVHYGKAEEWFSDQNQEVLESQFLKR
jgi:hypothetical protein